MPRRCTVCEHKDRALIEADLLTGTPYRKIADRTGLSVTSLKRHKDAHMTPAVAQAAVARQEQEAASADQLFEQLANLHTVALRVLEDAQSNDDHGMTLRAVCEARKTLEVMAKVRIEIERLIHEKRAVTQQCHDATHDADANWFDPSQLSEEALLELDKMRERHYKQTCISKI